MLSCFLKLSASDIRIAEVPVAFWVIWVHLKFFFSESLSTESGEEVSTREVKKILSDMVEGESKKKPLSDERLTELLQEKGYNIARRTVAKYREQLNIPVARLRKSL